MKVFTTLYDAVMRWSKHRLAERYLGLVSFAESSFFPIPVAVMLLPMCLAKPSAAWRYATITLVTSVLGGLFGYFVGHALIEAVQPLIAAYGPKLAAAEVWFARYGVWVVLMAGFSPVPYKAFTITAGSLSMPLLPFIVASIIGRASQFYLIAFLARTLGPTMEPKIRQYVEWLGWASVIALGGVLLWLNFG